jgi:uncharacterized protein
MLDGDADSSRIDAARFTTFLLKVASRCNIACDYCYMYEHNDQSWRAQPHLMSDETQSRIVDRLAEYAMSVALEKMLVIFHGGEPLLAGPDRLARFAHEIRGRIPRTQVDFSLQTNGILLDDGCLDILDAAGIGVSLSLDGPARINDLHRHTASGQSTFPNVMDALRRLQRRPATFTGVIAVIDPVVPPDELLEFFADLQPPALDLLLPDANYTRPPPGRESTPDLYRDWLIRAFDLWLDHYPSMPVRTFDALLTAFVGVGSGTDAFGFGDISLLSFETDGSYHDLDVLKITRPGQTSLGADVASTPIQDVAASAVLAARRRLLTWDGLGATCQSCPVVDVCGGGSVPHRYSTDGFANPTIYCREMFALIRHAQQRLAATIVTERDQRAARGGADIVDLAAFEYAGHAAVTVNDILCEWRGTAGPALRAVAESISCDRGLSETTRAAANVVRAAEENAVGAVAIRPSVVLWTRTAEAANSAVPLRGLDGEFVDFDPSYVETIAQLVTEPAEPAPLLHRDDSWLRRPFTKPIVFCGEEEAERGRHLARTALALIDEYDHHLAEEIRLLSPEIQFIRDLSAHPDKVVSFSDDVVPGALFLGLGGDTTSVDVYDLADSLIHEHRHQKLYLLNRRVELVVRDLPLVRSPWREELRPPSGLLHAAWVFVELQRFWRYVQRVAQTGVALRARTQISTTDERLAQAWLTLREVELTPAGKQLVEVLRERSRP